MNLWNSAYIKNKKKRKFVNLFLLPKPLKKCEVTLTAKPKSDIKVSMHFDEKTNVKFST